MDAAPLDGTDWLRRTIMGGGGMVLENEEDRGDDTQWRSAVSVLVSR